MTASRSAAVEELSLCGLIGRLGFIERIKDVTYPSDEDAVLLTTEAEAKKAVGEQLAAISSAGVTSAEKGRAKEFLEGQIKSVDPDSRGAEARTAKLRELLAGLQAAANKEEPSHVRKAKDAIAKSEKDYAEIYKTYEKWEKGKMMMDVEELKVMKRCHDDRQKRVEVAKNYYELQLELSAKASAPPPKELLAPSPFVPGDAGRGKAASKAPFCPSVRGGGPAARTSGVVAAGRGGQGGCPAASAVRQALLVSQLRHELFSEAAEVAPAPPPRPRPAPQRAKEEASGPVLSYSCTCTAVAEHMRIKVDQAKAMAGSSSEFAAHFSSDVWESIQERSLAIEKEQREQKKEEEKRKQAAKLAKRDMEATKVEAPKAVAKPAAKLAAAGAPGKAKAKAKLPAQPKKGGIEAHSHGNRFGGMSSDEDDDDGFTQVRKR